METTEAVKQRGNPNFGKKKEEVKPPQKDLRFKLCQSYEYLKPKDKDTGMTTENPYPAIYIVANAGVAWCPEKQEYRNWRYIFGYPTVWVDEQKPEPSKQQIFNEKNDIIFTLGYLRVKASDKAKIKALELNDAFKGNKNKVNEIPEVYELIDETKAMQSMRTASDLAFEAESLARSCDTEDMMPIASLYGIDVSADENDDETIRTQFIMISKQNPKQFIENFNNPKFKAKYAVIKGLQKGIVHVEDNKLIFRDSGKALMEVNASGDVAEQVAKKVMAGDEIAIKLVGTIQSNLS